MFRNQDLKWMTLAMLAVTLSAGALVFWRDINAGIFALTGMLLLDGLFLAFTARRYREITQLTFYLTQLQKGGGLLDIRDNREGELSILKNDIYKMALTLSEQAELLKKDKKYLAGAIADISHQLKTPLTSIIVMTDLLSDNSLPEEKRKEFTKVIHSQLERIEWLVSSLLKLSKIDAGAVAFRQDDIIIRELVEKALEPLWIPMELKEQTARIDIPDGIVLKGDFYWLREAVLNILKNSVEHTKKEGKLQISCTENPVHTALIIEDNGNGIAAEDLPHIFERFYKGKNASPDSVGIGLAMAKAVLQNHNARIEVRSVPGRGTRFTVKFYKQVV